MSDPKPANATPAAEKRRLRWLGRWLLKLVGWFFALSIVVLLIGTIVAWFAWQNLTGLANMAATRFVAPYRVELGKVDVSKRGEVHVDTVRLLPPPDLANPEDAPWVSLDGIDLTYDLDELRNERRFRTVTLRGPVVRIDDASLDLFAEAKAGSGESEAASVTPDLSYLGRLAERIEVINGKLDIDTSKAPRIQANWDLSVPPVNFGDEEWLNQEPLGWRFSQVRLGKDGDGGTIDRIDLRGRVRSDLSGVEVAELSFSDPKLKITPDWFPEPAEADAGGKPEPETAESATAEPATAARRVFEVLVGAFRIDGAEISIRGFEGDRSSRHLPDFEFSPSLDWRDLRIAGGRFSSSDPLTLSLADIRLDGHEGGRGDQPPTLSLEKLALKFEPTALYERRRLESIELDSPRLHLTPDSLARFSSGKSGETESSEYAAPGTTENAESSWEIGFLSVTDGKLDASGWRWDERNIPAASADWETRLTELSPRSFATSGTDEVSADMPTQQFAIANLRVDDNAMPEKDSTSIAEIGKIEGRFRFPELLGKHRMDFLRVERPVLDLTDERLPDWVSDFSAKDSDSKTLEETAEGDSEKPTEAPVPFVIGDATIIDGALRLDTGAFGGRIPKLQGRFSLETLPAENTDPADNDPRYHFEFGQLRVRSQQGEALPGSAVAEKDAKAAVEPLGGLFPQDPDPTAPADGPALVDEAGRAGAIRERDVAFVRELTVEFDAAGVQRDRRVEKIEVRGGEFQIGKGLREMVDGGEAVEDEADKAAEPPKPDGGQAANTKESDPLDRTGEWTVGEFVVTESQVRFESLIPQIEGLEFAIETRLHDIPLSQGGLLAQDRKQKVELAGIEVRDPYDSFITVAFLPTIFVEFSFAGLVNQRIDKIDLISPSIYVRQGLFWWIDYQRNYRKQNEGVGFGVDGTTAPVAYADPDEAGTDWEIREINAHFGKIVIAPTGRPIGIVPFPFNASTNMEKGEISLKLQIPREQQYVYEFPDLKLALFGLEGDIEFNVPIKQEDNNLVQTFTLERAVWKQYEVEKLYLTVTYDSDGIYGKFGGEAYDGYAEGQFNVYLNDVGRWDAWLAGTTFQMGPVTTVVAPDNFVMDGKVNAKLVSEGRGLVFGETWGEIDTLSPGRIDFTKLNEVIQDLPDDWSQLKRSATRLCLDTLKQFDYQTGKGDLYFVNRDGWLRLDLEGESGSRKLELYAHDWRAADAGSADREENPVTPSVATSEPEATDPAAVPESRTRPRQRIRQRGR
ncbi:MAG: hypothetical protein KDN19_00410 [Verrucomicrobiae bacterium]|nr:hypothetical protein [Verrucomicrobiae bacterium]